MQDEREPEMSADDIVAAFRARKASNGDGAPAEPPVPPTGQAPPASPAPRAPPPPAPGLGRAPPTPEGAPPPGTRPSPAAEQQEPARAHPDPLAIPGPGDPPHWSSPVPGRESSLAVSPGAGAMLRPAVQGAASLSPQSPALNLSDRLLSDRFVAARGSRTGVVAGAALAVLGMASYTALRLLHPTYAVPGWAWTLAPSAAALGLGLAVLFLFVPRSRSLRVRLAATQREEWLRVQEEAGRLRGLSIGGSLLALMGLAAAVVADRLLADPLASYGVVGGAAMAVTGLAVLLWAAARRTLVQRLYVQTLVLSRLEQTGLGPAAEPDPRVAPVLRSLDRLLGALPESAVRRFLASDEATQYLELIDELSGDRHAR